MLPAIANSNPLTIERQQTSIDPEIPNHHHTIRTTLQITNTTDQAQFYYLLSPNSLVTFTEVSLSTPEGMNQTLERLDVQTDQTVYELNLKPGKTIVTIIQSDVGSFLPDWTISRPAAALKVLFDDQLILTIGIAIILTLALYQLGIYVVSRDIGYLNLFALLAAKGLFIFAYTGWGGAQFGWDRVTVIQLAFVTIAAALHFGASFLALKQSAPISKSVIEALCVMTLFAAVLLFYVQFSTAFEFVLIAATCGFILLQLLAIRLSLRGDTRAKFYLVGVSFICLGAIWAIVSFLKVGYTTPMDTWILLASICVSCLVWCVSYAHQLKEFREKQIRDQEALLEARVNETQAIERYHIAAAESEAASEFLATMSHEIRTPMNGVLGMAEALRESELTPDQQKNLDALMSSGRLLMVVLNDILDYSKYSEGHIDLNVAETNVVELLDDSVNLLSHRALEKGLGLYIYPSPTLPSSISVDKDRLIQILSNLISNAIKFTDEGEVSLAAEFNAISNQLEFSVTDTGIGISSELQPKLFSRFTQADTGIQRTYGGTGLGLAIAKLLTESMNGTIGLRSSVGKGSCFWLHLPIAESYYRSPYQSAEVTIQSEDEKLRKQARLYYEWMGQSVEEDNTGSNGLRVVTPSGDRTLQHPVSLRELGACLENQPQQVESRLTPTNQLKAHLLVAEDNKTNQLIIARLLEKKFGCTYTLVENGQAAIDAFEDMGDSFDCILMDCEMPVVDGYAATKAIRDLEQQSDLPAVPIIALTAHVVESYRTRAIEAGMTGFVTKPIDSKELRSILNETLGQT